MISFDTIPFTLRIPGVYVESAPRSQGPLDVDRKILFIGQMLSGGTATPLEPVLVYDPDQAAEKFGPGSIMAAMFAACYENNDYNETWCVPVEDSDSGVAATGSITISGPVTAAGTMVVYIGGRPVSLAVAAGDATADIATALAAAIQADTSLPLSAAVDETEASQVNLTAKAKGTLGNQIDIRDSYHLYEALPKGLGLTVSAMSGGSGDPDITDALAAVSGKSFDYFGMPYTDTANLAVMRDELADRWAWDVMSYGHCFSAARGTLGELQTLGNGQNCPYISIMGAGKSPTRPEVWTGAVTGIAAYYYNQNAARPLQSLAMSGLLPPVTSDRFNIPERNMLLHDGISTFDVSRDGVCRIEAVITTYQTNAYGAPDDSLLYANTPIAVSQINQSLASDLFSTFSRHTLADDGGPLPAAGSFIATPSLVLNEAYAHLLLRHNQRGDVEHPDKYWDDAKAEIPAEGPHSVSLFIPIDLTKQFRRARVRLEHS